MTSYRSYGKSQCVRGQLTESKVFCESAEVPCALPLAKRKSYVEGIHASVSQDNDPVQYNRYPSQPTFSQSISSETRSKVTLTNWERLTNSPLLLPHCSAVQWNEYVFLLARDGTALLYHTKHEMWSRLWNCTEKLPQNATPPLAVHRGMVLTVSSTGRVLTYNHQLSQWSSLRDQLDRSVEAAAVISDGRSLYVVMETTSRWSKGSCHVYLYKSNEWVEISDSETTPLQSTALIGSDLYILAGGRVHKVSLPEASTTVDRLPLAEPTEDTEPVLWGHGRNVSKMQASAKEQEGRKQLPATAVAKPPFKEPALYVVKGTLFAFGGRDEDNQPTSDVLRYNPNTDSWESAGYMKNARYNIAVVTIQQEKSLDVMVIGGVFGSSQFVMEPRAKTTDSSEKTLNQPPSWIDPTSIVERCVVDSN